jgi:SAM-dependent methyltransferase
MNHATTEWMIRSYAKSARQYRLADEAHVTSAEHFKLKERLANLCLSFQREITVLDFGCGTGRDFHCFRNVKHLVGVDVSPAMLKEAANPVRQSEIQVQKIDLRCSDIYSTDFEESTFDVIVCFGVFGNGCAPTEALLRRMFSWLAPGGTLIFDVFDPCSLPALTRYRKMLRWHLHQLLPESVNKFWIKLSGWPPCYYCTFTHLWSLIHRAGLQYPSLERVESTLTIGKGTKFLVTAQKLKVTQSSL